MNNLNLEVHRNSRFGFTEIVNSMKTIWYCAKKPIFSFPEILNTSEPKQETEKNILKTPMLFLRCYTHKFQRRRAFNCPKLAFAFARIKGKSK